MQSDSTTQSTRTFRKKVKQLSIDVDGQDKPQLRASSAQHIRSNQFAFPGIDSIRRKEIDDTILKLNNLELERNSLLQELDRLKEGAVSALVEKQQVIELLKEKVERAQQCKEAMTEEKQKEYVGLLAELEMAITEVEQYKKEIQELRDDHISEVAKRDALICQLGQELEQAKLRLQDLSQSEKTLSDKYNQAQSEKQQLEDELIRSRVNLSILKESLSHSLPGVSEQGKEDAESRSQVHRKESGGESFRLNTDQSHQLNEPRGKAWVEIENQQIERLKRENNEQKERHMRQMEELKQYYERKLEAARNRIQSEPRGHISLPKTQSSISVSRKVHDLGQDPIATKRVCSDLRKQLKAVEKRQAVSNSNSSDEQCNEVEASDTTSQFSSRHFQYQHTNDAPKPKKVQFTQTIEETSPHQQKDPSSLMDWIKTISLSSILLGSLVVGGLLMIFVKARK